MKDENLTVQNIQHLPLLVLHDKQTKDSSLEIHHEDVVVDVAVEQERAAFLEKNIFYKIKNNEL